MARSSRSRKPARKNYEGLVVKPNGVIGPRVQAVGPEHFGIVAIDPAKHRSKFIFCDFFGQLFIEPTQLDHNQPAFDAAIDDIRAAMKAHDIRDITVAIERTGTYHRPVQHAFTKANLETRLVHPFASKQYRQAGDSGNKTDDTDTAAIFRATVNGFGLLEPTWPDLYLQLQWLCRQRRDLVRKTSTLRCQIQEQVHALMPGYVPLFGKHFFDSAIALLVAQHTGSALALLSLDIQGLRDLIRKQPPPRPVCRTSTLARLVDWARNAPTAPATPNAQVPYVRACLNSLVDDFRGKSREIARLEQDIAHLLARTPYILLLALPGINVASAAEFAGEAGPMENYANPERITGRAGLAPCRYQSDQVDRANGPLRRRGNRRLRAALLQIANNLVRHCHYYGAKNARWQRDHKDERWIRVKVAKSFVRLAFAMVMSRQIFAHPACLERHYLLDKLMRFHHEHGTDMKQTMIDLEQTFAHLAPRNRAEEVGHLRAQLPEINKRRKGPVALTSIIPEVLARLGVGVVQSKSEGLS
jgi:transposase